MPPAGAGGGAGPPPSWPPWCWPPSRGWCCCGRPGSGALDPEDATPQGTRALAHVLRDHGVPVQVRRTFADVERDLGTDGAATTLVVSRPDLLNPTRGADLAALLRTSGADVVLVSPGETLLSDLGLPVARRDPVEDRLRDPGCDDPVARRAGRALLGGDAYVTARGSRPGTDTADPTSAATVVGCYADGDDAAPLLLVTSADGRRSTVLGSGDALSNGQARDGRRRGARDRARGDRQPRGVVGAERARRQHRRPAADADAPAARRRPVRCGAGWWSCSWWWCSGGPAGSGG
ncbi:hypothetical protein GCM10025868_36940 [Angustibacter aerolatus]|uniref:DUF4350 domain-containing protein n=1 Tax=Angustibacter aerolatus TaxID=1162965 RepID=A0ABQ6JMU4_9ACTN|nr:DUF4350 domain-containing protein [Angustibacter aerolatus]GMA88444.1 hypothetical protein GCM10025868_36940 [Angustibacter aerolatus]